MKRSKYILAGLGVAVFTMTLASFSAETPVNEEKKSGKKKYHILHQKNGIMTEYDTIIPMNSGYSVEDFLAEKGIDDNDVKIIEVPDVSDMFFIGNDGSNEKVILRHLDENVIVDGANGAQKQVVVIHEETDVSEGDINVFIQEGADSLVWRDEYTEKNVEIKVDVDKNGKIKVQKFVNGEEVEVSEEELQNIESGNTQVHFFENGTTSDIELDSILQDIEFDIEFLDEADLKEGQQRIIIKEFRVEERDGETIEKEIHAENHVEVSGDEDFTVVLVTENYNESEAEEMQVSVMRESVINQNEDALKDAVSVFPNPNNGEFTIAFEQKNEAKTAVQVADAQGKIVFKEKLGNFSGSYRKALDLKKEGSGTYIVTVQQGDKTSVKKVIVE